jgi:hypothetical protein
MTEQSHLLLKFQCEFFFPTIKVRNARRIDPNSIGELPRDSHAVLFDNFRHTDEPLLDLLLFNREHLQISNKRSRFIHTLTGTNSRSLSMQTDRIEAIGGTDFIAYRFHKHDPEWRVAPLCLKLT